MKNEKNGASTVTKRARRSTVENRTAITLSISQADKDKLQMYAVKNHIAMSQLLRNLSAEHIPDDDT